MGDPTVKHVQFRTGPATKVKLPLSALARLGIVWYAASLDGMNLFRDNWTITGRAEWAARWREYAPAAVDHWSDLLDAGDMPAPSTPEWETWHRDAARELKHAKDKLPPFASR